MSITVVILGYRIREEIVSSRDAVGPRRWHQLPQGEKVIVREMSRHNAETWSRALTFIALAEKLTGLPRGVLWDETEAGSPVLSIIREIAELCHIKYVPRLISDLALADPVRVEIRSEAEERYSPQPYRREPLLEERLEREVRNIRERLRLY